MLRSFALKASPVKKVSATSSLRVLCVCSNMNNNNNILHGINTHSSSGVWTIGVATRENNNLRFYAEEQRQKHPKSKQGKESNFKRLSHEECVQVYDYWKNQGKQLNFTFYRQFIQHCNNLCWEKPEYLEKAFSIAEDMKKDGIEWNREVYFMLIQCCVRTRKPENLDKGFALKEEMEKRGITSSQLIYNTLIRGCALLDQKERAKPLFEDLMKLKEVPAGIKFEDVYKHLKEL
ncbi:hypothetical protein FDP41_004725 [Naegleria fowleri]|uniref:Uncharacterized protein n=1 Tax=Naegleria fowleri TaxID=5763 RepID=A0A6A5BT07_NAEFO|nr:uncharacterized protein FDP41_004725 [Naegleria fowleri]KAF0976049.1 hypothetical protein FDP41_004725 [Naegleria fowleri]CAG4716476.1 unnamed protein product [Naegleria fowleri]